MDDFFYDAARQHIHAQLTSSICKSKGLILLTGERGVGKSIMLRHLADELEIVHGVILLPPSGVLSCAGSLTLGEIVRICRSRTSAQFDGADDEVDESGLAELLERCRKADAPVALILDGADQLSLEALEHLKELSALSVDERGRLSIVLSGCLDAPNGLSCSAFEAARLSADVNLRLQRFQDRDVEPYICHRIRLAGRKGPEPFAPSAIDRITQHSGGNPLSINWICSSALVFASRKAVKTVSAETVDAVARGGLSGTTADGSSDSGKRADHAFDPEAPFFPKEDEPDFLNNQSHLLVSVSDEKTPEVEDEVDKFHFEGDTVDDAGGATENAALARFPNPRPLEEFAQEEPVGWWPQDRAGIVLRFVWVFLVTTLVVGVGGVYLSQTGRFDAIEYSKRWLAQISGNESTLPRNVPRERGFVDGRSPHWVEPSSKLDRQYSLKSDSPPSSGKARQFPEAQRQAIQKPLQVSGSPAEWRLVARSNEAFSGARLLVASRSIEALDAAIEKAGPDRESKPVTESNEPINRPPLAVTTNSGVEIDETIKITGSPIEIEPPIPPDADEEAGGREVVQESGSATEPSVAVESGEVATETGSAAETAPAAASEAVPAEMETAAGTGEMVESGEVAAETGSAAEAAPAASSEVVPAEMKTMAETVEMVESAKVATEAGSAAETAPAASSEAVPAEMETMAETGEMVESGEVATEAGSAAEADPPASSKVVPAEMETAAGTEEAIESPTVAVETRTEVGYKEAPERFGVLAKTESRPGTDATAEIPDVPAVSGPLPPGENIQREAKSPDFEAPSELRQIRRGGGAVPGDGNAEASKREEINDATLAAQLDRPLAEPSASAVNDDRAADLRSVPSAGDVREVSVPVTAREDLPQVRDLPQGEPEPQPSEPEVLAPGEPPTPFLVAETPQPKFDVDRLVDRGDQLLALGDAASARLFYRLAAKEGSAKGATAMGSTYDPVYLERIGFVGARPSPAEAIKWYRQAIAMGHRGAEVQLRGLTSRLERAAALGDGEAQRILEGVRN